MVLVAQHVGLGAKASKPKHIEIIIDQLNGNMGELGYFMLT